MFNSQLSAYLSSLCILLGTVVPSRTSMPVANKSAKSKIVVVGAGLSGLTAAYRLQSIEGFEVTTVEARQRVGGRVLSVNMPKGVAELGAFNIRDGGKAENVIGLIKELGLEFEDAQSIKYFDGVELVDCQSLLEPYEFTPATLKETLRAIRETSKSMSDVLAQLFKDNEKLQHLFGIKMAAYEGAAVDKLSASCVDSLYYMLLEALSVTHASFSDEDGYACRLRVQGGNSQLTEKLASLLKNKVQCGKVLHAVTRNEDGKYHLAFEDGSAIEADIVVMTIPCPVYNAIVIGENILPAERIDAIKTIQYGMNSKILYPASHPQVTGAYTNGRMIASYNAKISVITSYYIDEYAKFDAGTIADVSEQDMPFLKQIYKFHASMPTPVIARDEVYATYEGPVGHSWINDPFARGSYSCLGVGQDEVFTTLEDYAGEQVKKLFAPVDKTFFFSGEAATILIDFCGTLEAAVESSERIARIITKLHGPQEDRGAIVANAAQDVK